jgi:DNA topoisomerase-2
MDRSTSLEPEVYIPALPTILVNGFEASDQDWKTSIPPYNPGIIIDNLRRRIEGGSKEVIQPMQPMQPWYRDWTGRAERLDRNHYSLQGRIQESSENIVEVTELPPRMWTQDFLDTLDRYISEPGSLIRSYTEHAENQGVHLRITLNDQFMGAATLRILETKLCLHKTISTQDMVLLDEEGRACRYATVLDILEDFYHIRTRYYLKEKDRVLQKSQRDLQLSIDKSRFVELLLEGSIVVSQDEDTLLKELLDHGFTPISNDVSSESKKRKRSTDTAISGYEHLLEITVKSMRQKPMPELRSLIVSKKAEIAKLGETSIADMWDADLRAFKEAWRRQDLLDKTDRSFINMFAGDEPDNDSI